MKDHEIEIMQKRGWTKKTRPKCVTCDFYISKIYDPYCVKRKGITMASTPACEDYLVHPGLEALDKQKQIRAELKKCKPFSLDAELFKC